MFFTRWFFLYIFEIGFLTLGHISHAILGYLFDAFLVCIVLAVTALHTLLEESFEELLAELTNGRSGVRM